MPSKNSRARPKSKPGQTPVAPDFFNQAADFHANETDLFSGACVWVTRLADSLRASAVRSESAVVLALEGDLGVGKTTFVRALLGELFRPQTSPAFQGSPTYPIMLTYGDGASFQVHHLDLYRIQSREEITERGLDEILRVPRSILIIEWLSMHPEWASEIAVSCPGGLIRISDREGTARGYAAESWTDRPECKADK